MRKLFLMLGAPASGKDYWIRQHNLTKPLLQTYYELNLLRLDIMLKKMVKLDAASKMPLKTMFGKLSALVFTTT